MASIFTKIIQREIPAYIVAEDDNHIAFLDISPLVKGHTLVVLKKEIDYIFDINDAAYAKFHLFSKSVAIALKMAVPCKRVGVVVIGDEVPHAHIHLIPMNIANDMSFTKPKLSFTKEEMQEVAKTISEAYNTVVGY